MGAHFLWPTLNWRCNVQTIGSNLMWTTLITVTGVQWEKTAKCRIFQVYHHALWNFCFQINIHFSSLALLWCSNSFQTNQSTTNIFVRVKTTGTHFSNSIDRTLLSSTKFVPFQYHTEKKVNWSPFKTVPFAFMMKQTCKVWKGTMRLISTNHTVFTPRSAVCVHVLHSGR